MHFDVQTTPDLLLFLSDGQPKLCWLTLSCWHMQCASQLTLLPLQSCQLFWREAILGHTMALQLIIQWGCGSACVRQGQVSGTGESMLCNRANLWCAAPACLSCTASPIKLKMSGSLIYLDCSNMEALYQGIGVSVVLNHVQVSNKKGISSAESLRAPFSTHLLCLRLAFQWDHTPG